MLDYEFGKHELTFDGERYPFRELLRARLSEVSERRGGPKLEALEKIHELPEIYDNVEHYRQLCFSFFRMDAFQEVFKPFGAELIDTHFGGVGLIQKTPTIRIQLPNATSTSYHSDGWYGHGSTVRSFWMPLTEVGPGNTLYMARDINASKACMADIMAARADLDEINEIGRKVCEPVTANFGDLVTFSAAMIHGAERNQRETSRVSFDFRIAPDPDDIGSKPRSNFYGREELTEDAGAAASAEAAEETLSGISYSNLCNGKSAKAQLMLCVAYAEANNVNIVGNESEIVTLPYMPVMRKYLKEANDQTNCVVTFGVDIFQGDKALAEEILSAADEGGRTIVFAAEGLHHNPGGDHGPILASIRD